MRSHWDWKMFLLWTGSNLRYTGFLKEKFTFTVNGLGPIRIPLVW